jgi:protoheme ferro-lyase
MTPPSDIGRQTNSPTVGVLLSNLGTPDGTDYWSVRRYLAEFLSDRRVIEAPRLLWLFILNALILTTRPQRKGKDYATIWNHDRNESPLKTITRSQAEKLQQSIRDGLLGDTKSNVIVDWGMRYGNPSLKAAIGRLVARGCERILFVPLYPQYSAATSATACDKLFDVLASMRNQPALRVAAPYYDEDTYIDAIAGSLTERLFSVGFEPDVIVASFHGMPLSTHVAGRSLLCPVSQDYGPRSDTLGATARTPHRDVPVTLRSGRMVETVYGRDHKSACGERRKADRSHNSRLLGRLSGNNRGNRTGKREILLRPRRPSIRAHRLSERQ